MIIQSIPTDERPRERCLKEGASTLSLRECLAVLIGSGPRGKGCLGVARDILELFDQESDLGDNFFRNLQQNPLGNVWLDQIQGLGKAGRARLQVAFELAIRYQEFCAGQSILGSHVQSHPLSSLPCTWRFRPEEWIAFSAVTSNGKQSSWKFLAKGSDCQVNFSPKHLLRSLLLSHAEGFYLAHNHPNHDLSPSVEDVEMSKQLAELGASLGFHFMEHFIVTAQGWSSVSF